MFNPSNSHLGRVCSRVSLGAAALALWVPLTALSGLSADEAATPAAIVAAPDKTARTGGAYRVRCWQFGRLLFEENYIGLPSDLANTAVKFRGTDRNGNAIYVADTRNSTCLIQVPIDRDRAAYP
jgi:hypothetical protein